MTVADYIVKTLEENGVTHVFGMAGGLAMYLNDSFARSRIAWIGSHHEQCAGFAADGYARQSGKIGVACVTGGPGGPNIITALVSAYQDSVPMLVLVGQAKRSSTIAGTGLACRQVGTFEADTIPLVASITKYATVLSDQNNVVVTMKLALAYAMGGRPGPVVIEVPLDVQGSVIEG